MGTPLNLPTETPTSSSARLAFYIGVHKNPQQFKELVSAIYEPQHHYLLHVDLRAEGAVHAAAQSLHKAFSNVSILCSRPCFWGHFGQVSVTLDAIRILLSGEWDYFLNLSGQDFPLVKPQRICEFLGRHRGTNFIHLIDQRKDWPDSISRLTNYYLLLSGRPRRVPLLKRRMAPNLTYYGGSQWFALHRTFCEYVTSDPFPRRMARRFRFSFCADEAYFQTVIMNSPFRLSAVNDNLRYISWRDGGSHPRELDMSDFPALCACNKFYARKLAPGSPLLARLSARLRTQIEEGTQPERDQGPGAAPVP